jgi:hypothetical protein
MIMVLPGSSVPTKEISLESIDVEQNLARALGSYRHSRDSSEKQKPVRPFIHVQQESRRFSERKLSSHSKSDHKIPTPVKPRTPLKTAVNQTPLK